MTFSSSCIGISVAAKKKKKKRTKEIVMEEKAKGILEARKINYSITLLSFLDEDKI